MERVLNEFAGLDLHTGVNAAQIDAGRFSGGCDGSECSGLRSGNSARRRKRCVDHEFAPRSMTAQVRRGCAQRQPSRPAKISRTALPLRHVDVFRAERLPWNTLGARRPDHRYTAPAGVRISFRCLQHLWITPVNLAASMAEGNYGVR